MELIVLFGVVAIGVAIYAVNQDMKRQQRELDEVMLLDILPKVEKAKKKAAKKPAKKAAKKTAKKAAKKPVKKAAKKAAAKKPKTKKKKSRTVLK